LRIIQGRAFPQLRKPFKVTSKNFMKHHRALSFFSVVLLIAIAAFAPGQTPTNVTGSVTDPSGAQIPGASITLYSLDRISRATSDAAGHFHFSGISSGEFEIEVGSPGFKTSKQVYVADSKRTPDKSMELTIPLQIGAIGSPVYVVSASEMEAMPTFDCGPSDAVTYGPRKTPEAAGLSGIVVNRYPKIPVAGATLDLVDPSGARIAHQQTNERGEFQFKQMPPGRYRLSFQHAGQVDKSSPEFWITRENLTYVTIQAEQPGSKVMCK